MEDELNTAMNKITNAVTELEYAYRISLLLA